MLFPIGTLLGEIETASAATGTPLEQDPMFLREIPAWCDFLMVQQKQGS
jgi:hypothetical protein